jgi:hypothetical protein
MNKLIPLVSAAMLAGAAPLLMANDAHHPLTGQMPAPAATEAPGASNHMQEQMQKMQAQMDKIRQAKTPKERSKLLHEHMQSMREGMKMMREMPAMAAPSQTEMSGKETTPPSGQMVGGGMMGGDMYQMMDQMMQHMDAMQAR